MAQKFTREGWVDNIGKTGKLDTPEEGILRFTILDEIRQEQSNLSTKVLYLQKVQFDNGRIELRLCYYMRREKWVFGRFAALLPQNDFKTLMEKAREKGWV